MPGSISNATLLPLDMFERFVFIEGSSVVTHPHRDSDLPGPPDQPGADVISLGEAALERPRRTKVPVEQFLVSPEGQDEMDGLYDVVDGSDNIIQTLAAEISETLTNEDPDIYSLFLHDDGAKGLTTPELIKLYDENPLIKKAIKNIQVKKHLGDVQAAQLNTYGFRIFMNMVRYEWLMRTYDPHDPLWADRASRLGDIKGKIIERNLHPSFGRSTAIARNNTPSDYLSGPPKT